MTWQEKEVPGWTEQPTDRQPGSRRVTGLREQRQRVCCRRVQGKWLLGGLESHSMEVRLVFPGTT